MYTAQVKQLKCEKSDTNHIVNLTGNVKVVRHKFGVINLYFEKLNLDVVTIHLRFYQQNGAGHFYPFLVDNNEYNVCEFTKTFALSKILPLQIRMFHKSSNNSYIAFIFRVSLSAKRVKGGPEYSKHGLNHSKKFNSIGI